MASFQLKKITERFNEQASDYIAMKKKEETQYRKAQLKEVHTHTHTSPYLSLLSPHRSNPYQPLELTREHGTKGQARPIASPGPVYRSQSGDTVHVHILLLFIILY